MSTRRLVILISFLGLIALTARYTAWADTWWHLATARTILETRAIPAADPFSYTQFGQPWRGAQVAWIAQLSLLGAHQLLGIAGLNLWTLGLGSFAFLFAYRTWAGDPLLKGFVLILAGAAVPSFWIARPLMFGNLLLAANLWVLEDARWARANRLWLLPLLQWLWASSHGASFLGFILWGVYALDLLIRVLRERQPGWRIHFNWRTAVTGSPLGKLFLAGAGMLLAAALTPAGLSVLRYPVDQLSVGAATQFIQEWASPDFHDARMLPFLLLIVLTLAALGASAKRIVFSDLVLAAGFTAMALVSARNIPLFALVIPTVITRHAAPFLESIGWQPDLPDRAASPLQGWLNRALVLIFAGAAAIQSTPFLLPAENQAATAAFFPVAAAQTLDESGIHGSLFNSYNFGGYLIWSTPDHPVFIDGRADLHGDQHIRAWFSAVSAEEGWQAAFDRYDIEVVLIEPHWPLVAELIEGGWVIIFEDDIAVILTRPEGTP